MSIGQTSVTCGASGLFSPRHVVCAKTSSLTTVFLATTELRSQYRRHEPELGDWQAWLTTICSKCQGFIETIFFLTKFEFTNPSKIQTRLAIRPSASVAGHRSCLGPRAPRCLSSDLATSALELSFAPTRTVLDVTHLLSRPSACPTIRFCAARPPASHPA